MGLGHLFEQSPGFDLAAPTGDGLPGVFFGIELVDVGHQVFPARPGRPLVSRQVCPVVVAHFFVGDLVIILDFFFDPVLGEAVLHRLAPERFERTAAFAQLHVELGSRAALFRVDHLLQIVFVELLIELFFDFSPGFLGQAAAPFDNHQFDLDDVFQEFRHVKLSRPLDLFGRRRLRRRASAPLANADWRRAARRWPESPRAQPWQ